MTSKEVKANLKSAKSAIQAKEYKTALKHCEAILSKDSSNYNALVFAGLSHSETGNCDEARASYWIAMKVQPEQMLAYQGIFNLYVKHWTKTKEKDEHLELVEVCEKLLSSIDSTDVKKRSDIVANLCASQLQCGTAEDVLERVKSELEHVSGNDEVQAVYYELVFQALQMVKGGDGTAKYDDLVNEAFRLIRDAKPQDKSVLQYLRCYLLHVNRDTELVRSKLSRILDACSKLSESFPEESLPWEVMCEAVIQNCHQPVLDEESIASHLKLCDSPYAEIFSGHVNLKLKSFEESSNQLSTSMAGCSNFLPGWVDLCEASVMLRKYANLRSYARSGLGEYKAISNGTRTGWLLRVANMDEIKFKLTKYLAVGLCHSRYPDDFAKGMVTFEKLLAMAPTDASLHLAIGEGHISQSDFAKAMQSMLKAQELDSNQQDAHAWIAYLDTQMGKMKEEGISLLQSMQSSSLTMYLLGRSMWEADGHFRKEKKNCFTALVKAAKLDPPRGDIFFLLGNFYAKVQKDSARAKGCYQKAYALDPQHQEAAACIADSYVDDGQTERAIQLYENITKELGSAGGKWAWLRLGLYKLKAKDMSNAIQCFQVALRIDSNDSVCWECLGEGYLQRGSYTASWKAFDRARQLKPQSVYCLYQIARVKQVQGLYPDAIQEFKSLLTLFPDYVPALKGLGESELCLARHLFHEGRYQTGVGRIENAIGNLVTACALRKDLCCLWKLLGDCCVLVHSLSDEVAEVSVPTIILGGDAHGKTVIEKSQTLSLAVRFYIRAVELQPDNGSLWHDLGISFFRQAQNKTGEELAVDAARKSMNALKKALTHDPKNHVFWCSLGVVAASKFAKDPALAQHCFLTSIKCEQNNVQAWSNLATLYLEHDHVKKAHEAYKVAQSLEPSFTNSWVGQAIIAETIGSDETMDLYRHSTELGLQKQGSTGYSSWVAKVMRDISNRKLGIFKENITDMNAVSTAMTQISKSCAKNPKCPWSSTIHGFLLEHSGLYQSAEASYGRAYKSLYSPGSSKDDMLGNKKNIAACNFARLLCKNGKYKEACSAYTEHLTSLGFHDTCGLALSYFNLGMYEKAVEFYQMAGSKTADEAEKSQVMVALAMVYWKMDKKDESKTMLYQCFQNSKPGLQALLSFGVSVGDDTLIAAAVGEILKKINDSVDESELVDDCLLIAAAAKVFGDPKVALMEVQKSIQRNPSSARLRALLCRLLVEFGIARGLLSTPKISEVAMKLMEKKWNSMPLHRDSELWRAPMKFQEEREIAITRAISSLAAGSHKARLQGQKPLLTDSVIRAADASDEYCSGKGISDWNAEIRQWIVAFSDERVPSQRIADSKLSKLLLTASGTNDKARLQSIMKEITGTLGATRNPAQSSKYFGELLVHRKMYQVARKMFEKSLVLYGDSMQKSSPLLRALQLSYHLWTDTQNKSKDADDALKATLSEMLKLDQNSSILELCQGLVYRSDGNHRKAKSFFNRIVNSTNVTSDRCRNIAVWYLYRTLHERDDWTEIEKLAAKAMQSGDDTVAKIMGLLPPVL